MMAMVFPLLPVTGTAAVPVTCAAGAVVAVAAVVAAPVAAAVGVVTSVIAGVAAIVAAVVAAGTVVGAAEVVPAGAQAARAIANNINRAKILDTGRLDIISSY